MRKRTWFVVVLLTCSAAACKSEIDNKPQAEVKPVATTEAGTDGDVGAKPTALQEPSELVFDKTASSIGWVGSKVTKDESGVLETFDGTVSTRDGAIVAVTVNMDATSIRSEKERLTKHLQAPEFFDTAQFPKATFSSSAIEKQGGDNFVVRGVLDLRGVKKEISFPAVIKKTDVGFLTTAEFTINRFDFGVIYKGQADDLVRDEVLIKLNIVAVPKS